MRWCICGEEVTAGSPHTCRQAIPEVPPRLPPHGKYVMVHCNEADGLWRGVENMMKQGYRPTGGVAFRNDGVAFQAMHKP